MTRRATPACETTRREARHKVLLEVRVRDVAPVITVTLCVERTAVTPFTSPVSTARGPVLPTDAHTMTALL